MLSGCFGFVPLVCRCSTLAPCFQRERCLSLLNAFANGSTPSWAYRGYNLSAGDNEHASQCTRLVLSWVGFLWCVLFLVIEAYWYACLCLPARSQDDGNDNSGSCVLGGYEDARVDLREADVDGALQFIWMLLHGIVSLRSERPDVEWKQSIVEYSLDIAIQGLVSDGPDTSRARPGRNRS